MRAPRSQERFPDSQAIEVYKPGELRRRRALGLQKGRKQTTGRWAEQMPGKGMFVMP